ncbi:MAG: hypothetical protein AMXMBFR59_08270 [Rhodanobacteraceae bacterium]
MFLSGRNVVLGVDRVGGTLGFAQGAVDALVRVDHEEIRAGMKAVHRADFDAIGVLALDAVFGDNERHVVTEPAE